MQCIQEHGTKIVDVALVSLQGCEALHDPSDYKVESSRECEVNERIANCFKRIAKEAKAATPVERKAKFSPGLKDAMLQVPAKVTMDAMHNVLLLLQRGCVYSLY